MCGIMGYIAYGDKRPDGQSIQKAFQLLQSRGHHSAGWSGNDGFLYKNNVSAAEIVKTPMFMYLKNHLPSICIFHTRWETQGTSKDNNNNHPVVCGDVSIVHNGHISNDEKVAVEEGRPEVDSYAIAYQMAKWNWDKVSTLVPFVSELSGTFAVAAINKKKPNTLVLYRTSNPIVLGFDEEAEIMYFASTEEVLTTLMDDKQIMPWSFKGFNVQFHRVVKLPENIIYKFTLERGLEGAIQYVASKKEWVTHRGTYFDDDSYGYRDYNSYNDYLKSWRKYSPDPDEDGEGPLDKRSKGRGQR